MSTEAVARPSVLVPNRVVVVLNGKYAGKKAVVLRSFDEGTKERPYSHCIVAGIKKCPRKVTKEMDEKTVIKKSRFSTFIKVVNSNHLLPTRYVQKFEFDGRDVSHKTVGQNKSRKHLNANFHEALKKKYFGPGSKFFFKKLYF